jgi:hypothetical protein
MEAGMDRRVSRIETAAPAQRGAATHANRFVVPADGFEAHSPFLMMMEDWFAPPAGFPTHPHRGMETVTLVLEGAMEHRDHTGGHGMLNAGDVQWMTAGRGVMHSEMPGPQGVHSLQLWLNLPAAQKMSKARYADQRGGEAPLASGPGWQVRVYAGRQGETEHPASSSYPMGLCIAALESGAEVALDIGPDERGFLYALEGSATVGADQTPLQAGQIAWFDPAPGADRIPLHAGAQPFRAALFSGRPIPEPVVAYGPFVMNTQDEIRQAFADYQRGTFVES